MGFGRMTKKTFNKSFNPETRKLGKAAASGVRKIVKAAIKSNLGPEIKYSTQILTMGSGRLIINGASSVDDLFAPAQTAGASTDSLRIGDQVKLRSLQIRLYTEALATYLSGTYRVVIFQWHSDTTSVVPTTSLVYTTSISGGIDSQSPWNMDSRRQGLVTVVYDKTFAVVTSQVNDTRGHVINVPLKHCKKTINFTSGAQTGRDHLFMIVNADKAGVTTNAIQMAYTSRGNFYDI